MAVEVLRELKLDNDTIPVRTDRIRIVPPDPGGKGADPLGHEPDGAVLI